MRSALLPLLLAVPAAGALILLLAQPAWGRRWIRGFGAGVAATTAVLAIVAVLFAEPVDVAWVPAIDLRFTLRIDGISAPLVLLTVGLVLCCLIYTLRVVPKAGRERALIGVVLLLEVGMLGTFLAGDLLLFFLFFETVLIPMWFLIAVWGDDDPATEVHDARAAATKFALYTLLGSALMLVGFLVVHAQAGTFDIEALTGPAGAGLPRDTALLAFGLIALGLLIKVPTWPLHTWLPGAHTAAPTIGSVLLAGVLLKMGAYGLIRIAVPIAPDAALTYAPYLGAFGVAGILYASLACLVQRDLKRLIAFSSIGHMGYVLLGISTLTPTGLNGALFAGIAHGLITGLLFFVVGAIKDRHGTTDFATLPRGLYGRLPRLAGLLAFTAVASLALPGLAGFWGEALTMLAAYNPAPGLDPAYFRTLMALAGLGTVLTAGYLLLMIRRVAQGPREAAETATSDSLAGDVTRHEWLTWTPLALTIVVLGFAPGLLLTITNPDVRDLLNRF